MRRKPMVLTLVKLHMNTKFEYLYRDAANYKQFGEVIIPGILKMKELRPFLRDQLLFIPSKVGLPDLQPKEWSIDDHIWHEVENLIETMEQASIGTTAHRLLECFRVANENQWYEFAEKQETILL